MVQCSGVQRAERLRRVAIMLSLLLAAVVAVGCRSAARIEIGRFVAIRPNELTETVAVVWIGDDPFEETRVDVYRVVRGRLPTVWPHRHANQLEPDSVAMIRSCEVQRLSSWKPTGFRRIDGLWPVGADGSVLTHEYRLGVFEEGVGWEGATLVMRDSSGRRRWELSPSDRVPVEERVEFMPYPHQFDWIVGVAFVPDTGSVCVFARGGHFRTIGLRDGRVGTDIVDQYSYAR
jgi:hypothetical protein